MDALRTVPWRQGWWLNRPPNVGITAGRLVVQAARGSDAWRTTSYGFVRDSAHALLNDLPDGWAVEVGFLADFDRQFDQAGVLVRIDETRWTKAGVEFADGALQASAVVTKEMSDCCAPERDGLTVTFTRWAAGPADEALHPEETG